MRELGLFLGLHADAVADAWFGFTVAIGQPSNFSRAAVATVRTGASTIKNLAANECGVGRESDVTEYGYSIEQAHGNAVIATNAAWGRDISAWNDSAQTGFVTWSNASVTGPDGGGTPKRAVLMAGNNIAKAVAKPAGKIVMSVWVRGIAGGEIYQGSAYSVTPTIAVIDNATLTTTWSRRQFFMVGTSTAGFWHPVRADSLTLFGGLPAGARDVCFDFAQMDIDGVGREYTPNASQPADVLLQKMAKDGRVYLYTRFRSKCASTALSATAYIYYVDANNHLRIDNTGKLYLTVAGVLAVTTVATLTFTDYQVVEVYVEFGGNQATLIQKGVAGAWTTIWSGPVVANNTSETAQLCAGMDVFLNAFLTSKQRMMPAKQAGLTEFTHKSNVPRIPLPWGKTASAAETHIQATSGSQIIAICDNGRIVDSYFSEIQLATDGVVTTYNTLTSTVATITYAVGGAHIYRVRDGGNTALWNGTAWVTTQCSATHVLFRGNAVAYYPPTLATRVVVAGDSITTGVISTHASTDGAFQIIRDQGIYSVTNCGAGNLALWDVSPLGSNTMDQYADALVSAMDAVTNVLWIELGFNDYFRSLWTAAAFGAAYGNLLDLIHAKAPAAKIVAQTPILAAGEGANLVGNTLGAYRSAIATAQSTRSAWCTLVDGSAWLDMPLTDGIHPNTVGHAAYAVHINDALALL